MGQQASRRQVLLSFSCGRLSLSDYIIIIFLHCSITWRLTRRRKMSAVKGPALEKLVRVGICQGKKVWLNPNWLTLFDVVSNDLGKKRSLYRQSIKPSKNVGWNRRKFTEIEHRRALKHTRHRFLSFFSNENKSKKKFYWIVADDNWRGKKNVVQNGREL